MQATAEKFRIHTCDIALIFLAATLVVFPILYWGVPVGTGDFTHHIQIASAYFESIQNGVLIPDWVLRENHGYGAVTVRFYPPLFHCSLAAFKLIFGTWHFAFFATLTFWSFVGGLGVFVWMRDIQGSRGLALASASLFSLAPYHLNQLYNSSMLGEFVAVSILPFCFLFARRICIGGRIPNVLGFAISLALLILSNLPQTIIGILCIGLYVLFYLSRENVFRALTSLIVAGVLGLALSSFYWIRMVTEMSWISVSHSSGDPAYDYKNHFLLNGLGLDAQGAWFASLMFVGSVVIVIGALIVTGKYRDLFGSKDLLSVGTLFIFASFMLLPISKPIWDNVDLLQRIQFPWRFLSVISLASSMLLAWAIGSVNAETWRSKRPVVLVLSGMVLILATFSFKQVILAATYMEPHEFNNFPERVETDVGLEHFRPVWSNDQTFKTQDLVVAGNRGISIRQWDGPDREFIVSEGEPMTARIAVLYYPHWRALINGQSVPVKSVDGALSIDLPSISSEVKLAFVEPSYSLASRYVSLFTFAAMVLFSIFYCLRSRVGRYE